MEINYSITVLLSLGTVLAHILIVLLLLWFLFFKKSFFLVENFLGQYGMMIAFKVALISTLASLFYSNVIGFAPCELCWFQRIFMYPLVIMLGMALWKKDFKIINYALVISGIGFVISLFQNYMYYFNNGLSVYCEQAGFAVSCVKRYVFEFGYVSIPVMALTGFVLVIIFLILQKKYNKNNF